MRLALRVRSGSLFDRSLRLSFNLYRSSFSRVLALRLESSLVRRKNLFLKCLQIRHRMRLRPNYSLGKLEEKRLTYSFITLRAFFSAMPLAAGKNTARLSVHRRRGSRLMHSFCPAMPRKRLARQQPSAVPDNLVLNQR